MRTSTTCPIEEIAADPRLQARFAADDVAIADYRAAYERGEDLPPLDVFDVAGVLYLVDGFHRGRALLAAGHTFAKYRIVGSGTFDEAVWYATKVNATNGIRRTPEDKRKAVRMALENPIGAEQSSRVIADHIGVSHTFVSEIRAKWEAERASTGNDASSTPTSAPKRVGKDGKARPATQPKRAAAPTPAVAKGEPTPATESHESDAPRDPGLAESRVELDAEASVLPPFAAPLAQLAKDIAALRLRARKVVADTTVHAQSLERHLKDAEGVVEGAIPSVCRWCQAASAPGCTKCRGRGWLTKNDSSARAATEKRLGGAA